MRSADHPIFKPPNWFSTLTNLMLPLIPVLLSPLVLGREDAVRFLVWWAVLTLPSLVWLPVSLRLFKQHEDGGYLFSKPLALALSSLAVWTLSYLGILPFNRTTILIVSVTVPALAILLPGSRNAVRTLFATPRLLRMIGRREALFGLVLLLASYGRTFRPAIESIPEKFMNYGFMMSLMRTEWLPAQDMWLAGEPINYYYYGHYVYTYLTKLAGMTPAVTYNLGMATTFTFIVTLAFALVYAWTHTMLSDSRPVRSLSGAGRHAISALAGTVAAVMVQIAGNSHAFLYNENSIGNHLLLGLQRLGIDVGHKVSGFYFPDSTRFIGYNPDIPDKTIHEFPYYSYLIGDLHPHLVNLAFVLLLLGLLHVLYCSSRFSGSMSGSGPGTTRIRQWLTHPVFLLSGVLLGIFTMCNFWDLAIYFAVAGFVLLLCNLRYTGRLAAHWWSVPLFGAQMMLILIPFLGIHHPALAVAVYGAAAVCACLIMLPVQDAITRTGAQMSLLFLIAHIVSLPFSLSFQPISKEIALATRHTTLYQLWALWGTHIGIGMMLVLLIVVWRIRSRGVIRPSFTENQGPISRFLSGIPAADLLVCGLFVCGTGLILLPEIAYVVDIYQGSYSRANTMFKFTYQAFVLLSMVMAYAVVRIGYSAWQNGGHKGLRILTVGLALTLLIPLHYPLASSTLSWQFGYRASARSGLDGSWQIGTINSTSLPDSTPGQLADDLEAIRWFNENVEGQPVILEMFGKSYRDNCRISAFTGLPTVLGWETHQQLWRRSRETPDAWSSVVLPRQREISAFYADPLSSASREFLDRTNVRYVIVGTIERAIAGRWLETDGFSHDAYEIDDRLIRSLGETVFERDSLYVVRVD